MCKFAIVVWLIVSDVSENKRIHFTSMGEKIGKDVLEFTVVVWLIDGF